MYAIGGQNSWPCGGLDVAGEGNPLFGGHTWHPNSGTRGRMMGADAPIPPTSEECRRPPEGTPPRRIECFTLQKERGGTDTHLPRRDPTRRRADSLPQQGGGTSLEILTALLKSSPQFTVWSRDDGTPCPNFNEKPDPDHLAPERGVTKQF